MTNMNSETRVNKAKAWRRLWIKFGICVVWMLVTAVVYYADKIAIHGPIHRRVRRDVPIDCENDGKWDVEQKKCSCTLGWVGSSCETWHNHYCYFDNGFNYRGKLSVTQSGTTCLPWTTEDNSRFGLGKDGIGVHNYCRNPDNDEKGLWCYVGGDDFIGYCNATRCPDALKDLLLRNTTEIGTEDDTSAAVQFLFGPLISGVCVGVVFLLGFIAVAEYLRRRRFFARKKKAEEAKGSDAEKGEKGKDKKEKGGKNGNDAKEDEGDEWLEIRPLGGIITVDVDTGKEKLHTYPEKLSSTAQSAILANGLAYDNIAYLRSNADEDRHTSAESSEIGPPPPYHIDDRATDANLGDSRDRRDPGGDVAPDITNDSQTTDTRYDVISDVSETADRRSRRPRPKGKRKGGNRRRSESSRASMDSQEVVEEVQVERPIPKPRKSLRAKREAAPVVSSGATNQNTHDSTDREEKPRRRRSREPSSGSRSRRSRDRNARHSRDSTGEKKHRKGDSDTDHVSTENFNNIKKGRGKSNDRRHGDDVTRHGSEERSKNRNNDRRKTQQNRAKQSSSPRKSNRSVRHESDDVTRSVSEETTNAPRAARRKSKQRDRSNDGENVNGRSGRKKSVKDMANAFERQEVNASSDSDDVISPDPAIRTKEFSNLECNEGSRIETKVNSRDEPTTFL